MITKEQMLQTLEETDRDLANWPDPMGWLAEKRKVLRAIRSLIESSGDKASVPAPSPAPAIKKDLTVGPSPELKQIVDYLTTPRPPDPLPKEVEEAMGRMAVAIHEAGLYRHLLVKRAIASTYTTALVEKDFDDDQSALAVIKSALRPKVVSREWVYLTTVDMWGFAELKDAENKLIERFRELGYEVSEGEMR